jgi:hypothetical protein
MTGKGLGLGLGLIAAICSFPQTGFAQQCAAAEASCCAPSTTTRPVPQFVNYAGALADIHGKPLNVVERDKPERERGYYTDPELYGAPKEQGLRWAHQPATKKPRGFC